MNILKRDGKVETFTKKKTFDSLINANTAVSEEDRLSRKQILRITDSVAELCETMETEQIDIDKLEDIIEQKLMAAGGYEVAKRYITYRYEKERVRLNKSLTEKLTASNVQNQNANVDEFSFGGRMGETVSFITKQYALEHLISKKAVQNHQNNEIYIHDLDSYAVGSHNCFLKSTRFVTEDGIRAFTDFHDGDIISVLNREGRFVPATVHMYGRQPMQEVTFSRCGNTLVKVCTKDHRWILADGTTTTDIRVGDKIIALPEKGRAIVKTKRDKELFALGFVLGDGCDHKGYYNIRLCGKKNKYEALFKDAGYSIAQTWDNGITMMKRAEISKQDFLTHKVWSILSAHDKEILFEGYYAADGYQTTASSHIATADERLVEMIEAISPCAGFHVSYIKETTRTTNYKEKAHLWIVTLSRTQRYNSLWTVKKVEKGEHRNNDYEAWCLDVPDTHSFVLEGGIVTGNCLSIPFDKLLAEGFKTRQCDIRPAGSINTALQLVAVLFQLQSLQQFGGVAATHLDWTLVPYVRLSFYKHYIDGLRYCKGENPPDEPCLDKKTRRVTSIEDTCIYDWEKARQYALTKTQDELSQGVEGLYHNLNTLQSRSGNQLPFTSINYGTCTLPEGRMVIKALLEGSIKGVGKFHKTPIFPCGIFQCMKGVNRKPGDTNYDMFRLALKSTSLRLYPNYANCEWSNDIAAFKQDREAKKQIIDNLSKLDREQLVAKCRENPELAKALLLRVIRHETGEYDVCVEQERQPIEMMSTMGCRTYNGFDITSIDSYKKNIETVIKEGKLYDNVVSGAAKDGRGNISPNTIIMPTLAMMAKETAKKKGTDVVEEFMKLLDKKINEAKDMLLERFDWQCSQPPKSAKFMYENNTMSGYVPEEGIKSALRHGTNVIGQLGLAETLQILIGCDQTSEKGMELAKRIENLFNTKCAKFKKEYKVNFGVYYTPAENLCHTAMKKFKAKYGEIKNVSDRDYFTNSIHCPVWQKLTPFEKIDLEAQLTGFSNGGCITYVELDSSTQNNVEALEELVNYAMDKDIPYFAVNIPNDSCDDCGYTGDIGEKCPKCGSTSIQRLRRVTGYLTGNFTTAFNKGKQAETIDRVKHTGVEA